MIDFSSHEHRKVKFSGYNLKIINNGILNHIDGMQLSGSLNKYIEHRGLSNINKGKNDIYCGKWAEFAVAYLLKRDYHFPCLMPDLEIRYGKDKGWECDLPYSKFGNYPDIACKSCNENTVNFIRDFYKGSIGLTWLFQKANLNCSGGRDSIFNKNEKVAFVYVGDIWYDRIVDEIEFLIFGFLEFEKILPKLTDPAKKSLKNIKSAYYYEDLKIEKDIFKI